MKVQSHFTNVKTSGGDVAAEGKAALQRLSLLLALDPALPEKMSDAAASPMDEKEKAPSFTRQTSLDILRAESETDSPSMRNKLKKSLLMHRLLKTASRQLTSLSKLKASLLAREGAAAQLDPMQAIVKEVLHLTTLSAKDFPPSLIQRALAAQQSRGISRALGFRALDACWAALQQLESIPASDVSYPNLELALCLLLHPVAAAFSRHAQAAYPPLLESAPGHPQGGLQLAGRALAAVAWQGVAGFIARASACKILAKSDSAALSAMGTLAFDVNPADVQPLAEAPLFEWLTPYIAFPGSGPMLLSGPTIGVDEDEAAAREHVRRMGSSPARAAAFPVRLCAWALFRLFAGVAAQGPQGPMAKAMAKFLYL